MGRARLAPGWGWAWRQAWRQSEYPAVKVNASEDAGSDMRNCARVSAKLAVVWLLLSCQTSRGRAASGLLPSLTPLSLASCTMPATACKELFVHISSCRARHRTGHRLQEQSILAGRSRRTLLELLCCHNKQLMLSDHCNLRTLPCSISTSILMPYSYLHPSFPSVCILLSLLCDRNRPSC